MLRKSLIFITAALLILVSELAFRHFMIEQGKGSQDASTQILFESSFPDVNGDLQAIRQWQGKTIIVNFWATWCPPCLEEMPELSKMFTQYQQQGLVVVGISSDDLDSIRNFATDNPVSYPLLSGEMDAMPLGESLGNDKGVLPYTVIIKPDGNIAKTYFGLVNQVLLEQTFLPILAEFNG